MSENKMLFKTNENTGAQEFVGDKYLLSVSGGKDSTAMILYFKESLIDPDLVDYVFMDTGWEDYRTYEYLNYLEQTFSITINRIRANLTIKEEHKEIYEKCLKVLNKDHSDFIIRTLNSYMFPNTYIKWCTERLKIRPFNRFVKNSEIEYVSCVGIRKEESLRRAKLEAWEYNQGFDLWVHRPLIEWSYQDVIDIHKRHNVRPNPLYLEGANRVGCYPCIHMNKQEMQNVDPKHRHIEVIRILEEYFTQLKGRSSYFFTRKSLAKMGDSTIDTVLDWAKTSYGGRQYQLFFEEEIEPSCVKWGMCGI